MIRRSFRFGLTLGLLAGLVVALVKMLGARAEPQGAAPPADPGPWPRLENDPMVPATPRTTLLADPDAPPPHPQAAPPAPAPAPPKPRAATDEAAATRQAPAVKKAAAAKKAPTKAFVEPRGDVCPTSHPVKAKLSSKIFHLPGMLNYQRTIPDRCYRDAKAAERDGLRAAKR